MYWDKKVDSHSISWTSSFGQAGPPSGSIVSKGNGRKLRRQSWDGIPRARYSGISTGNYYWLCLLAKAYSICRGMARGSTSQECVSGAIYFSNFASIYPIPGSAAAIRSPARREVVLPRRHGSALYHRVYSTLPDFLAGPERNHKYM